MADLECADNTANNKHSRLAPIVRSRGNLISRSNGNTNNADSFVEIAKIRYASSVAIVYVALCNRNDLKGTETSAGRSG